MFDIIASAAASSSHYGQRNRLVGKTEGYGNTNTTTIKYGIKITHDKGPVGWVVGKDSDVMLFADKVTATAALKKMKADDRYSWNCEAVIAEFTGWGK